MFPVSITVEFLWLMYRSRFLTSEEVLKKNACSVYIKILFLCSYSSYFDVLMITFIEQCNL